MEKGDAGFGALIMYSEPSINLTDRVIKAFEAKARAGRPILHRTASRSATASDPAGQHAGATRSLAALGALRRYT